MEMMEKMMPMMLEDVDMLELMPRVMPKMLEGIKINELLGKLLTELPKALAEVVPVIKMVVDMIPESTKEKAPKVMMEVMPEIGKRVMPVMMEGKSVDDCMPRMMMEMMPHCLAELLPKIPTERRIEFILLMASIQAEKGRDGMSGEDRERVGAQVMKMLAA